MKQPNQEHQRRDARPLILIVFAFTAVVAGTVIPFGVWLTGIMVLALAVVGGLFGIGLAVAMLEGLGVIKAPVSTVRQCGPLCGPHTGRTIPRPRSGRGVA